MNIPENADCEYAVQNRIAEGSAFKFLVESAIKKCDLLIKKVFKRKRMTRFKYGIEDPGTVEILTLSTSRTGILNGQCHCQDIEELHGGILHPNLGCAGNGESTSSVHNQDGFDTEEDSHGASFYETVYDCIADRRRKWS